MKFAILCDLTNSAGINIFEQLNNINLNLPENIGVYGIKKNLVFSENIDKNFKQDFIIFATCHKSEKQIKTLSIHAPGNWHNANFGGKPKTLCPTSTVILKKFFIELNKQAKKAELNKEYDITMEVTHHGPYIKKPCLFIEIGATEKQWKDKKAGEIIAKTIINSINNLSQDKNKNNNNENYIPVIAIGGLHYANNFNKTQLNSKYALGHICPNYALPFDQHQLEESINKTIEKPKIAILDWKGIKKSEDRQKIVTLLEKNNIKIIRREKIRK